MATLTGKSPRVSSDVAVPPLSARPPAPPADLLDLEAEAKLLRSLRAYEAHGQAAKTLVKHDHFRVVLIALKRGRRCPQHHAGSSLSVQAFDGSIKVHLTAGGVIELRSGYVLALAPAVAHDLEALEDSTLLVTLAWTGSDASGSPFGRAA